MPFFSHTVAIVNGQAGGGSMRRIWPRMLAEIVDATQGRLSVEWTPAPSAATEMTRAALRRGADRILAVGGDGTVHEVVNGFFDTDGTPLAPDAVLAPLPCGTGGDFRRALGAPSGVAAAARLGTCPVRSIDLLRVACSPAMSSPAGSSEACYVANVASCGLGGHVVQSVRRLPAGLGAYLGPLGGTLAYFGAILYSLSVYHTDRVAVEADGRALGTVDVRTIAVANGSTFGGGLPIAPEAQVDDGWMDVVMLGPISVPALLARAPTFYRGHHLRLDAVRWFRARRLTLRPADPSGPPNWLEGDGELLGSLPASFTLVPNALSVQA